MPARGNVIKRTHPGSGVFVVLNMDERGSVLTRRDNEGRNRRKKQEREMKEGGCSMSRWTTTTLVVACWMVIGCCEHMMREDPTRLSFCLGTLTLLTSPTCSIYIHSFFISSTVLRRHIWFQCLPPIKLNMH